MSVNATYTGVAAQQGDPEAGHRLRLMGAWATAIAFIVTIAVYGFSYYTMSAADRPYSPKHAALRPGGPIGIKLGIVGVCMFGMIYLYYFRKQWKWLANIGSTRHWLDFHIVLGVTAPIVIAFHATFKFGNIAGMAYWIMLAVALSGIVGRYLYSQIPRRLNAAELTWQELQDQQLVITTQLASQKVFPADKLIAAFHIPDADMVRHKSAMGALFGMFFLDIARPFRVAALRRRALGFGGSVLSLGGFLKSANQELENVVTMARRQASLSKRMVFLSRTQQVFQLWHLIHRPFSYAFVVLAVLHIITATMFGYIMQIESWLSWIRSTLL
jgi:hypothetical protein